MAGREGVGDRVELDVDGVLAARLERLGGLVARRVGQVEHLLRDELGDAVRGDVVEPDGDQGERAVGREPQRHDGAAEDLDGAGRAAPR